MGSNEPLLRRFAQVVKGVAPAKVMFAAGFEPDGHAAPAADGPELFGTAKDYIAFRKKMVDIFKEEGANNVVWVLDFSHKCEFDKSYCDVIPKLIPTDGSVGWLFWNMFQMVGKAQWEKKEAKGEAVVNYDSANFTDFFYNFFLNKPTKHYPKPTFAAMATQVANIPWGVGAWGTNWQMPNGQDIPHEDRCPFVENLVPAIQKKFPKIKGTIYFNSLNSIITPCSAEIEGMSDLAHGNKLTKYKKIADLVPCLKKHLTESAFTENDKNYAVEAAKASSHDYCYKALAPKGNRGLFTGLKDVDESPDA